MEDKPNKGTVKDKFLSILTKTPKRPLERNDGEVRSSMMRPTKLSTATVEKGSSPSTSSSTNSRAGTVHHADSPETSPAPPIVEIIERYFPRSAKQMIQHWNYFEDMYTSESNGNKLTFDDVLALAKAEVKNWKRKEKEEKIDTVGVYIFLKEEDHAEFENFKRSKYGDSKLGSKMMVMKLFICHCYGGKRTGDRFKKHVQCSDTQMDKFLQHRRQKGFCDVSYEFVPYGKNKYYQEFESILINQMKLSPLDKNFNFESGYDVSRTIEGFDSANFPAVFAGCLYSAAHPNKVQIITEEMCNLARRKTSQTARLLMQLHNDVTAIAERLNLAELNEAIAKIGPLEGVPGIPCIRKSKKK